MKTWLAVLLCAVLTGCGLTRRGPLDPSLGAFIPSDAVALAGVHIDLIRATPTYQKLASKKQLPSFDEFPMDTGFDPANDVHDLLVASDGNKALAAAHGEFKGKRPTGLEVSPYKGYTLYIKHGEDAIVFLDDHTVLGGPPVMVRAAIDQYARHADAAPSALLARVRALPTDAQVWAVATGWKGLTPDTRRQMGNAANITVDFRKGVQGVATGDCQTDNDAKTLAESLQGLLTLARMGIPQNKPELNRLFDNIHVQQQGRAVKLTIELQEDLIDQLAR